jgi:hypothetical protein
MTRITLSVSETQKQKILSYCKNRAAEIYERPGFVYSKLVHSLNLVLDGNPSLDEVREGMLLLSELQEHEIKCSELREIISQVKKLVNSD